MRKTRFLSIVLCAMMILSSVSLTAFAVTFDDVESDETVSWAKESIHKMTDAGYIKGYEDGTFRPFRAITKMECLILMSRMLGFEDKAFADVKNAAVSKYNAVASKYNGTYSKEISYLLYCGVMKESELVDYASAANANTQLLRYQAAMLMAKLMGEDETAKAYKVDKATYADDMVIPTNAKPYVEYVTAEGIMNGMDATAAGEPQFSPVTSLTRAQMATLLARLMDRLKTDCISGTVEDASKTSITVNGKKTAIESSSKVYVDGSETDAGNISEGDTASVVKACGKAYAVTVEAAKETTVVYGVVLRKSENADGQKITIADYEDEDVNQTYTLKSGCTIKINNTKAAFGDIMADDFVKLELSGSKVAAISTEDTKIDITGKLVSTEYDDDDHVYLNVGDKDGKNVQNYVVSTKGVVVSRDDEEAEFSDLSAGDTVTLRLTYGKVTRVTATSSTERFSGLLTEIIISSNPAVTISVNGKATTYKLRSDAKITVAGETGDIYDLRPNITVSGTLDSSMVKSLTAASVAINEEGEFVGTVVGKNTTYKVLTIEDEDGNKQSVYYNSGTTFLNRNGSNTTVKSLEDGTKVSVVGAEKNGVFEATIIILK